MLLIPTSKNGIWRPYNVMDDRLLGSQLKLRKKRFCGSSKGWLIAVEKDFTVTLTNLFLRLLSFDVTTRSNPNVKVVAKGIKRTGKIKVFELDLKECKWIEKDTLGGISLFVGDNSAIYVLASELSGWQPNCIYLNHDNDFASINLGPNRLCVPHDYGVYNVETQSFSNSYGTRVKTQMKNAHKAAIWIMPASQL
ncbi:PREDICTED: F-box [Prunus dulcis]|uniref:PREDICTED: F-box n=1 Tax=Prunus dulcis TaxID=3755 RepID=A0A5E4E8X7_PRUDU|nr:PREDICTED: F-box [Prunus dulcis]